MQEDTAPPRRRGKALWFFALGLALIVVIAVIVAGANRNSTALVIVQNAARGFGYDVAAGSLDVDLGHVLARDVHVRNLAGEPVLDAREINVAYSLRDLLPGGKRLFGLKSVAIAQPHVTLIHHRDGTYNITLPQQSAQNAPSHPPPLDVALRVTDGSIDLIDRFVRPPGERRERLIQIHADGAISPAITSYYHAGALLEDGGGRYPIRGSGRFDDPRGFEIQHWTAEDLPIAGLANFALNSHAIVVEAGDVRDLDLKLGALATPAGPLQMHVGVTGRLSGGVIAAAALTHPVRNARGSFVVDDDSATLRTLDADLNGIALRASGALYHFAAPEVALALTARGDLARAGALSPDSAKLPLGGAIRLEGLAEGSASDPVVFARIVSPHAAYGAYRIDAIHGFAALSGKELDLVDAALRYGPAEVGLRGSLLLTQHTQTIGYATLAAPLNGIPYAANLLPGMRLQGVVAVSGRDAKIAAHGYVGGVNGADRLDAPFALAADGSGSVGPLVLERRDGASVYARAVIERGAKTTVAFADVHRLSLLPAAAAALPGLTVPALPPHVDATLDASLTGIAAGTRPVSADGALHAYGSWGDVRATAAAVPNGFAAHGRLVSSFERLAPLTGNVGARGGIDVPFAVSGDGRSTVVQIRSARFPAARIRGIALQGANATLGIAARTISVYAADLHVGGHDVTAMGSFGNGGRVHVTAGDLDLDPVRAAGVKVAGGSATVIADIGGSYARPTANVLAAVAGARYAQTDVGGDAGIAYDGSVLHIERATLNYGSAYADASGNVAGLVPGRIAPRYDINAQLADADIATLARTVKNPLRYPEGTLAADVRIAGSGASPSVSGDLTIPEGSLNGLYFNSGRVDFSASPGGVTARNGRLTVGTTTLAFGGSASRAAQAVDLYAPRVDLADFNGYFDEAEVLSGTGRIAVDGSAARRNLRASANVALAGVRYRRFELGRVGAVVRTAGSTVAVTAAVDGNNGRLHADGHVNVPVTDPLRDIIRRSYLDLSAQIAGIDLGNVLPAAGIEVPVVGIVDGAAVVRGRYPALTLSSHAALTRGVVGRVPIDHFAIAADAANGRGRITGASLIAPGLVADLSGNFGFRPQDRFALHLDATSSSLRTLATTATGKNPGVDGTLTTATQISGTLAQPRITGAVDLAQLTYSPPPATPTPAGSPEPAASPSTVPKAGTAQPTPPPAVIPHVHAEFDATRRSVDVRNGSLTLRSGSITFDGHAPLGGGAATPIAFDFAPHGVDVASYSSLLPDGSVAGIFDGNVGVRGTLAAPLLSGSLTLRDGSYRSSLLTSGLTAVGFTLNFAGTSMQIANLHATAAPGTIDGSGSVAVGDLRDPVRGLRANVDLTVANVRIAAPKFYVGYVEGSLTAVKAAGAPLTVGGNLSFSRARIPYTALLPSGGSTTSAAPALPAVAFNLGVNVGRDVRVQSGPVDIGTTGSAQLGGTLAKPTLAGQFTATDGTVSLYRTFNVQYGSTVSFDAPDGITPTVDATAVTSVPDPPTDVLLHITGPSTHLNLDFSSQPPYSREQILGLLVNAQALGAVSGVASTGQNGSNPVSIGGIGTSLVATQFTQQFLQPFTSKLGGALGLSDLDVNYNANGGGVSTTARRRLGKDVSFVYGQQFGGSTQRTSIGVNVGTTIAGAQLTFYQTIGSQSITAGLTPFLQSGFLSPVGTTPNYTLQSIEPPYGSGFVFSYQRKYW